MNSDHIVSRSSWRQWIAALGVSSIMLYTSVLEFPGIDPRMELSTILFESSLHVGLTIFGAFLGATLADAFGRKSSLFGVIIFVIPRALGIVFIKESPPNRMLQVFAKIGLGTTSTVVPLYIAEIADTENRRHLMTLQMPIKYVGSIISMAAMIIFPDSISKTASVIVGGILLAISLVFFFITIVLFPESPDYLYSKKKYFEATKSLGFLRGISNMTIGEETIELSNLTVQANANRHGFVGKISEMFQFANRRNLAIIVSLIAIRWASGQGRNKTIFIYWAFMIFGAYDFYAVFICISVLDVIFSIFVTLGINLFSRKLFVLFVLSVNLIAAIIGTLSFMQYQWVLLGVFLIHNVGYLIIHGVTLAYMGEFFPTNIRALAVATVMSCEFLIQGISLAFEQCLFRHFYSPGDTWLGFYNAILYFCALAFVLIFFPKINKIPCSQIRIATSTG